MLQSIAVILFMHVANVINRMHPCSRVSCLLKNHYGRMTDDDDD